MELHIELFFALSLPFIDPLFYIIRIRLIIYGSCCEFTPPRTHAHAHEKKNPFLLIIHEFISFPPPPPQEEENNNNVYVVRMKNLFSFLFLFFAKYYWDHYSNTVYPVLFGSAQRRNK